MNPRRECDTGRNPFGSPSERHRNPGIARSFCAWVGQSGESSQCDNFMQYDKICVVGLILRSMSGNNKKNVNTDTQYLLLLVEFLLGFGGQRGYCQCRSQILHP